MTHIRYLGSKSKLSKHIKPIIEQYITEGTTYYIEPFVGGANIIDKIDFPRKIGSDINPYLIELLKYAQDLSNVLPETISEAEYNEVKNNRDAYEQWYVGLVGFIPTFASKFFGGYGRSNKTNDYAADSLRNLEKQRPQLSGIEFRHGGYEQYSDVKGAVLYCDGPYRDTTKYANKNFNYEYYYEWLIAMSEHNTVLVSEYWMPEDRFEVVFEKEMTISLAAHANKIPKKVDKLYVVKK